MNRPRPFLRAVSDYDDDPDLTPDLDDVMLDVDGDGVPDRVSGGQGSAPGRTVDVRHGDELVPREDDALVPIPADRPAPRATVVATVLAAEDSERKPVLPAWASDWLTLRSTVRRAAVYGLHVAAWHLVRLPQHVTVMAVLRMPRGLYRGAGAVRRRVADTETAGLQREAVRRGGHEDAKMHLTLTRQRRARSAAPEWATWLAVAAVMLVLARLGTNPDQTMFGHAVSSSEAPRLTSVVVAAALQNLGIAALTPTPKRPATVQFVPEIARDGQGYRAEVNLPHGTTATEVIERREKLSANLRRPLGAVWPERAPHAHEGRLMLWVGDRDLSKGGPTPWPLASKGACNFFKPFPFGTNPRGQEVTLELFEANVLVGSQPGQGKTATARVSASAVALDPLVEMWVHELKGSGDRSRAASSAGVTASSAVRRGGTGGAASAAAAPGAGCASGAECSTPSAGQQRGRLAGRGCERVNSSRSY
jgi:S-DNA-T family DNA segregation ATPase FtsK/SpoIIIE